MKSIINQHDYKKRKRENVEKDNKDERDAGFRVYRTNLWIREASNAMHVEYMMRKTCMSRE